MNIFDNSLTYHVTICAPWAPGLRDLFISSVSEEDQDWLFAHTDNTHARSGAESSITIHCVEVLPTSSLIETMCELAGKLHKRAQKLEARKSPRVDLLNRTKLVVRSGNSSEIVCCKVSDGPDKLVVEKIGKILARPTHVGKNDKLGGNTRN